MPITSRLCISGGIEKTSKIVVQKKGVVGEWYGDTSEIGRSRPFKMSLPNIPFLLHISKISRTFAARLRKITHFPICKLIIREDGFDCLQPL